MANSELSELSELQKLRKEVEELRNIIQRLSLHSSSENASASAETDFDEDLKLKSKLMLYGLCNKFKTTNCDCTKLTLIQLKSPLILDKPTQI